MSKDLREGERPFQAERTAGIKTSVWSMPGVFKEQHGCQHAWSRVGGVGKMEGRG